MDDALKARHAPPAGAPKSPTDVRPPDSPPLAAQPGPKPPPAAARPREGGAPGDAGPKAPPQHGGEVPPAGKPTRAEGPPEAGGAPPEARPVKEPEGAASEGVQGDGPAPQHVEPGRPSPGGTTIHENRAKGEAWERRVEAELRSSREVVEPQITILTPSGTRTRVDFATRDADSLRLVEAKPSATAPLTANQARAFPEITERGGVVVGKGKPGIPGGTIVPPGTVVEVLRP